MKVAISTTTTVVPKATTTTTLMEMKWKDNLPACFDIRAGHAHRKECLGLSPVLNRFANRLQNLNPSRSPNPNFNQAPELLAHPCPVELLSSSSAAHHPNHGNHLHRTSPSCSSSSTSSSSACPLWWPLMLMPGYLSIHQAAMLWCKCQASSSSFRFCPSTVRKISRLWRFNQ